MRIVIIEDEQNARKRLSKLISEVFEHSSIVSSPDSVESAQEWFRQNEMPDMVFIDINLGDGSGFDVLNTVNLTCPYVFTTAYDQYAIEAFQTNSIAYLLKPVSKDDLQRVLKKMQGYNKMFGSGEDNINRKSVKSANYKSRFIIRYGDRMKTLAVDDIAYFFSLNRATFVCTSDNFTYNLDYTLDVLEALLDPHLFFRINRRYLVRIQAIEEMKAYTKARILITLKPAAKEVQMVSTDRSAEFKQWLAGDL